MLVSEAKLQAWAPHMLSVLRICPRGHVAPPLPNPLRFRSSHSIGYDIIRRARGG